MFKELGRFHRDDTGAPELSTIMLVALIAVPLIIGVILFGQNLWKRFAGRAADASTKSEDLDKTTRVNIPMGT